MQNLFHPLMRSLHSHGRSTRLQLNLRVLRLFAVFAIVFVAVVALSPPPPGRNRNSKAGISSRAWRRRISSSWPE